VGDIKIGLSYESVQKIKDHILLSTGQVDEEILYTMFDEKILDITY
jgi:hypothetical protein